MHRTKGSLHPRRLPPFPPVITTGEEVITGSGIHRTMMASSERAMCITSRMSAEFNSLSDTRAQLEKLSMGPLPKGVGLFPPFTTDCGLNTHLGEGIFINSGCRFQDQGGIYIGDRVLIGHNCVIVTLNLEVAYLHVVSIHRQSRNFEHEQVDRGPTMERPLAPEHGVLVKLRKQVEKPLNLIERARRELPHERVIHDTISSLPSGRTSRHLATQPTDFTLAGPRR